MKYPLMVTLVLVPFLALLSANASASSATMKSPPAALAQPWFRLLPMVGRRERAVCLAIGSCLNKAVTCPVKCPERKPKATNHQKACAFDCATACAATCKELTQKTTSPAKSKLALYQTWCKKTSHTSLCESTIQSDPRKNLKTSPQGLVIILISAAQSQANATTLFINKALKNRKAHDYDKMKLPLEACLGAFNVGDVKEALKLTIQQVSDRQRCSDVNMLLDTTLSEVSYDCSWAMPTSIKYPTLKRMDKKVTSLLFILATAQQILGLIGCNVS